MQTIKNPIKELSDDNLIKNYLILLEEDINSKDDETLGLLQAELKARDLDPFKKLEDK